MNQLSLRRRNVTVRYEQRLCTWDLCILMHLSGRYFASEIVRLHVDIMICVYSVPISYCKSRERVKSGCADLRMSQWVTL